MKNSYRKTILVIGGGGFVGSHYLLHAASQNYSKYSIISPSHKDLDITNEAQLKFFFHTYNPHLVINFAAFRDANLAEKQRGDKSGTVWRTNVVGTSMLVKKCKQQDSFLIHLSTDMVFSGDKWAPGPYNEQDEPSEDSSLLSWYGWTKALGERVVRDYAKSACIRIGNVTLPIYDRTLDYVGKIVHLYDQRKLYTLFDDQFVTLTSLPTLYSIIDILVAKNRSGVFHAATKDIFTPYELGQYLLIKVRGKKRSIDRSSIVDYLKKYPCRYPQYGGLLTKNTSLNLKIEMNTWKEVVDANFSYFKRFSL